MSERDSPLRLLELATGYQRARTLFSVIELDLPTLLAARPRTLIEIAGAIGADRLATDRFLHAAVALGLVVRDGAMFRNAGDVERFLVRDAPEYLGDAFRRYDRGSYRVWTRLVERLRTWRPGATEGEPPAPEDQGTAAIRAQHGLSLLTGRALGEALDLSAASRLLDLGGGSGAMSIALCRRYPRLRAIVVETPAIAGIARESIRASGLADRIDVHEADFTRDALPGPFDVALLANLLSAASAATNRELFGRVFAALPPGGRIVLSGWILDDDRTGPLIPVLFCLEDINWGAPDVERSAATYAAWLAAAGFAGIERLRYFEPTSALVGTKPDTSR